MRSLLVTILAFLSLSVASISLAQAPDSLSFQGFVTDPGGAPINNPGVSMTFKLYEGSTEIWSEIQPSVNVENGIFNVLLGSVIPLDTVQFNRPLFLGIKVGADPEISPHTPLAAAAYAMALPGLYTVYQENVSANKSYNVVGGGANNVIGPGVVGATISGGGGVAFGAARPNSVLGDFGTVGGGSGNTASGPRATVGGGVSNAASAENSTVGGGTNNIASDRGATVPGGTGNHAEGKTSFAAGFRAYANHHGSFVWSDRSLTGFGDSLASTAENQFLVRAAGGIEFIGAIDAGASLDNHVVVIRNDAVSTTNGPDVLALKTSASNADGSVNFISFYDGDGDAYGRVEGNGSNGVVYGSTGGDYAEYLPRLTPAEKIQEGDIVGVFAGRVSRATQGAHRIMVVTDRPAVTGNMPTPGEEADYERIAFVGLVSVKVVGPVSVGDYIVPSGLDDGTGVAISAEELDADDLGRIAGRAWEASSDPGVKGVMLEIGLDQSAAAGHALQAANGADRAAIEGLYELVKELQAENEQMRAAMARAGIR